MMYRRALFTCVSTLALGLPTLATADAGAYLAGRQATLTNDFEAAARYLGRASMSDPTNKPIAESALAARLGLGDFDGALPFAERVEGNSLLATLAITTDALRTNDWDTATKAIEPGTGTVLDPLVRGWAAVQSTNDPQAMLQTDGLPIPIARTHSAFAQTAAGQYDAAVATLAALRADGLPVTREATLLHAELLSQLDRPEDARTLLTTALPDDAQATAHLEALGSASLPLSVATPQDALALAVSNIAVAMAQQDRGQIALIYARLSQALAPSNNDTRLLTGQLLLDMDRPALAADTLADISQTSPDWISAEQLRASALDDAGDRDAALAVLAELSSKAPEDASVLSTYANLLQKAEQHTDAVPVFDKALSLTPEDASNRWLLLYFRGISHFHTDNWPGAETDFRAALDLNPDQPQVLNYLGYSLVERNEKLEEALEMIERAVDGAPQSGAIVDSLAWALFRLGRYDEAIGPMERAVELEPSDPIVSDHLGDVLWAVGRTDEAAFQWHRALSFDPEPAASARIRRKLDIGLDAVLAEEGAAPLRP